MFCTAHVCTDTHVPLLLLCWMRKRPWHLAGAHSVYVETWELALMDCALMRTAFSFTTRISGREALFLRYLPCLDLVVRSLGARMKQDKNYDAIL